MGLRCVEDSYALFCAFLFSSINSNLRLLHMEPLHPTPLVLNHYRCFLMCRQLFQLIATLGVLIGLFSSSAQSLWPSLSEKCIGNGSKLKYLSGDALIDSPGCLGPNNVPYPSSTINRAFNGGSSRKGRQSQYSTTLDPIVMQSTLLNAYREVNDDSPTTRHGKLILSEF